MQEGGKGIIVENLIIKLSFDLILSKEIAVLDEKLASQELVLNEKIQKLQDAGNERVGRTEGKRMETCHAQDELTKETLHSLVSRIVVNPGGEAEIHWK